MFRSPLPGRPAAVLLAVVTATSLSACGPSSPDTDRPTEPTSAIDARPVAGSPVVEPTADDVAPAPAPDSTEHDHLHLHEDQAATVPSSEVCGLLEPSGCALLPDRLTEAQVDLVTWAATTLAAGREAPDVVLGAGIVACAFLDDVPYREMVVIADQLNRTESDPSLAMVYAMTPFVTPAAVTFLCPENTEAARADMVEVVCAAATPEVCAAFEADWLA